MGISFTGPFGEDSDVEYAIDSVKVISISFGDDQVKTHARSVSFGGEDLEPLILKSLGSGKMVVERSISFKGREFDKLTSIKDANMKELRNDCLRRHGLTITKVLPFFDPNNPKHEAAVKLQKVYKSFRTRRKLADCAVIVEQSWWELLDFAKLKRSSISFFATEKHETAISRWSRARTRAAKVGKGLSKNGKAQKLALQHWLEAIDPRHRYGHNLQFYYVKWLQSKSREPFFYWLDIGEGKEVNIVEKCPRSKLQQQCIKYLGPMERKAYEVVAEDGKFIYKQTGELLHTTDDAKWIFVLSTSKALYVGKKRKGTFQHSSFLAGGVTTAAGRLIVKNGLLEAVWPHSGHYRPTEENFKDFLSFLRENNVDLTDVKTSPVEEEEGSLSKQRSTQHLRNNSCDEDFYRIFNALDIEENNVADSTQVISDSLEEDASAELEQKKSQRLDKFSGKLTNLQIPERVELFERLDEDEPVKLNRNSMSADSQLKSGYESADKGIAREKDCSDLDKKLFRRGQEDNDVENIPKEAILQRINSKKETNSYQLGKQLSCKWTTGAGPRIGCVRDYPSKLQFQALEKVNLSPRSATYHLSRSTTILSRKFSVASSFAGNLTTNSSLFIKGRNQFDYETQCSRLFKRQS
ncbi:hypothetical protein K2173_011247 [Erythroxylum novogranatense]|uniref:IQ domain-containing protein IQM2-like n=1 Tax=Erythroxylum novogranatense TaxID=1862640 RepID=A0AAV8TT23_9ROSI|nr:hypothetical protein K2173_011247 [Erythroxylum novogranatense]